MRGGAGAATTVELRADGAGLGGDAAAVCRIPRRRAGVRCARRRCCSDSCCSSTPGCSRSPSPARRRCSTRSAPLPRCSSWRRGCRCGSGPGLWPRTGLQSWSCRGRFHRALLCLLPRRAARRGMVRAAAYRRGRQGALCRAARSWSRSRCLRRSSRSFVGAVAAHGRRCWRSSCLIAWRAMASGSGALYYIASFFAIATQAVWSAVHLTLERLDTAVAIYVAFGLVSLGVPVVARRISRPLQPAWGGGVVLLARAEPAVLSLARTGGAGRALGAGAASGHHQRRAVHRERRRTPADRVSQVGSVLSWVLMVTWWSQAAGSVGVLPSLMVVVGLTLVTLAGHAWSVRSVGADGATAQAPFARGLYLGLIGHLFLLLLATDRTWSLPPWPVFAALAAMTLATSAAALWSRVATMHAAGTIAAAAVVTAWSAARWRTRVGPDGSAGGGGGQRLRASVAAAGQPFPRQPASRVGGRRRALCRRALAHRCCRRGDDACLPGAAVGARRQSLRAARAHPGHRWPLVAVGAVVPAWVAVLQWQARGDLTIAWPRLLAMSATLYAVFAAYPFVVGRRARDSRDPYLAAILASAMAFFGARAAFVAGGLDWMIGAIPVIEGAVLALMLRSLLSLEPRGQRDLGRLALVAGAALAFVTVAIPLQLKQQWITIGWALEGAALAWLYRRIPASRALLLGRRAPGAVFVRLALNPEVLLLRATRLAADFQLVSLRLRPLRGSHVRRRLVACRRRTIGLPEACASRRSSRAPASSCCSCCSISRSPTSTPLDRRSCSGSAPPSRRI